MDDRANAHDMDFQSSTGPNAGHAFIVDHSHTKGDNDRFSGNADQSIAKDRDHAGSGNGPNNNHYNGGSYSGPGSGTA